MRFDLTAAPTAVCTESGEVGCPVTAKGRPGRAALHDNMAAQRMKTATKTTAIAAASIAAACTTDPDAPPFDTDGAAHWR